MSMLLAAAALAHGPTHGWPCDEKSCAKPAQPPGVFTTRLNYTFEGLEYEGYVAQPSHVARAVHDQGPLTSHNELLPIALVVHGMDGEGEIEQFRADQLAHLGFIAFAVDLFGKDKRPHGDFVKGQEYVTLAYSDMARLHRQLAAQVEALTATFPIADAANFIVAATLRSSTPAAPSRGCAPPSPSTAPSGRRRRAPLLLRPLAPPCSSITPTTISRTWT